MVLRTQKLNEHQGRSNDDRGIRKVEDGPAELVPAQFEKIHDRPTEKTIYEVPHSPSSDTDQPNGHQRALGRPPEQQPNNPCTDSSRKQGDHSPKPRKEPKGSTIIVGQRQAQEPIYNLDRAPRLQSPKGKRLAHLIERHYRRNSN